MSDLVHRLSRGARLGWDFLNAAVHARAAAPVLAYVERFCLFVGYPRSGHSLVGSLIDAHRHAIIAHELDALRYIQFGFSREQLFWLILDNSERFTRQGRSWTGYSYAVPNQWQGRTERLRVIGDKRGGDTSRRLARRFDLLRRLQDTVRVPLRVIHVVRNPFDNLAAMVARGDAASLEIALQQYDLMSHVAIQVRDAIGQANFMTIWLDDLTASPVSILSELCAFLDLDAPDDYLNACAALVFKQPQSARQRVSWQPQHLSQVAELIRRYDFLNRYAKE